MTEWKSMRVGFKGQQDDLWVDDVLNIGVDPRCAMLLNSSPALLRRSKHIALAKQQ